MLPYIDCFGITIYLFPVFLTFGLLLCIVVFLIRRIYDKTQYRSYLGIFIWMLPLSLLGGKIVSVGSLLLQRKGNFIECVTQSGNVFYGCLLGGAFSLFVFSKHYYFFWLDIFDICASLLPLGQAIGRIGCFLNGCCYGKQYDGFGAIQFPIENETVSVFPTWFCEAAFCFMLFVFLQFLLGKTNSGIISALYLICYSVFRFIIEFVRGDSIRGMFCGMSTSQYLSVFVLILGFVVVFISKRKNRKNRLFPKTSG